MASITELLDKLKNARATVELVEACGKRVCSSEEHWDCPYGNEGMTDCVERAMLDNDMFLVDGSTVSWKLLLYRGEGGT